MWAEFVLVLDPALKVFLRVLRFSSLSKNQHAAYSSWLLTALQLRSCMDHTAAASSACLTLLSCVLAVLARAIRKTVIIIIIIIIYNNNYYYYY